MTWRKAAPEDFSHLEKFLIQREVEDVGFSAWLKERILSPFKRRGDYTILLRRDKDHASGDQAVAEAILLTELGLIYPIVNRRPPDRDHSLQELAGFIHQARVNSVIGVMGAVALIERLVNRSLQARVDYHLMAHAGAAGEIIPTVVPRGLVVRRAESADALALFDLQRRYELEEVCLDPEQFNETACFTHLKDSLRREIIFVAERNGRAVAKSGTNACGYKVWQVGGVYTLPPERGKGLATLLMRTLIECAAQNEKSTCLFVKKTNAAALALYQKLGYKILDGFRIAYFRNG